MKKWAIAAVLPIVVAAAATGWAAIPGGNAVISGCYERQTGILRVIDAEAGRRCLRFENPIEWNQQGLQGTPGVKGDKGDPGSPGPPGPSSDFGVGVGLEKHTLALPPPLDDQTLVQLTQEYRLPQQCAAGSIPQKANSGAGWQCGAGAGGAGASRAYVGRGSGVRLRVVDATVASVTVPAGSYVVNGKASLYNGDSDDQHANCKLSTGDLTQVILPPVETEIEIDPDPLDIDEVLQAVSVLDVATVGGVTTIAMTCATFNGGAFNGVLTAMSVGGVD
jgi:hypothetical protein